MLVKTFDADIFMTDPGFMSAIGWRVSARLVTKAIALELLEAIVEALEENGISAQINIDYDSHYDKKPLRGAHSAAVHNPLVNCLAMQFTITIEVSNSQEIFDQHAPLGLGEVLRRVGVDAQGTVNQEIARYLREAINDVAARELSTAMRQQGYKNVVRVICDGQMTEYENQR